MIIIVSNIKYVNWNILIIFYKNIRLFKVVVLFYIFFNLIIDLLNGVFV